LLIPTAIAILALPVLVAACGDDNGGGGSDLSGTIRIDGSSTVAPLSEPAGEQFNEENPNVDVTVGTSGTGGGFEKFCAGETDISDASRQIEPDEERACQENGIEYEEITVANDALTVVVNPENPVTCMTVDQLKQIWNRGSNVSSWGDVDGLEQDFSEELELFGPGTDSGTFDYFTEAINGEEGVQRSQYNNVGEDDNATVTGVGGSTGGMGYFGFSFFQENEDTLKALEVDGGDGCVAPTEDTINDNSYAPLSRPLFIYPDVGKAKTRPELKAFVDFYLANTQELSAEAGYVALPDELLAAEVTEWEAAVGG
jgi:phosphate transport system substrate-binding protein